eukprot:TRINITY_DN417_c0_g1_i2.p1 TRINITY_DN417_c0_g1~~TRINITY_DN417_c0_g1_i2.p1  ORF type:complete len:561 (-),score=98.47 TRINITY_DN417_c0_g1_i2:53-1735(-)
MTGYSREEIVGVNCRFLQGKFSDGEQVRNLSEKIANQEPCYTELLNYTKDGRPFWNNFVCVPVYGENKSLLAFVAVQNDMSIIKLDNNPSLWSSVEVALFISSIGYPFCCQLFLALEINGRRLLSLKRSNLETIGVSKDCIEEMYTAIQTGLKPLLKSKSKNRRVFQSQSSEESLNFPQITIHKGSLLSETKNPPVLSFGDKSEEDSSFAIRKRIITQDEKIFTIGILPECAEWNQKSFLLEENFHQPLYTNCFSTDLTHVNFIGTIKKGKESYCAVISVSHKGPTIFFAEQTPMGYHQWSRSSKIGLLEKYGRLDEKAIMRYFTDRYRTDKWVVAPKDPAFVQRLIEIDETRSKFLLFGIALTVRRKGQNTRKEIFKNSANDAYNLFTSDILQLEEQEKGCEEHMDTWKDKKVRWFLAPELDEQDQRRFVGNCLSLVVFNTDGDSFDPSVFFLGSVTCFVCVVTPREGKYRLDFYFHYVTPKKSESITPEALMSIPTVKIHPEVPHGYLFDKKEVKDFIMTKIHNALVISSMYHPILKRVTVGPLQKAFQDLQKEYYKK